MKKLVAVLLAASFAVVAHSQTTINSYKYVLVPQRYDFLKSDNQYGLNSLSKTMLEGVGFNTYMADETLPAELAINKCNALKAEVVERKKFLTTCLTLLLKDCQGNVVYKSVEGKSTEKEWDAAYREALLNAFSSLRSAQYKYDSTKAPQLMGTGVVAVPAAAVVGTPAMVTENSNVLYAQATTNGYQLIDMSPKKVMTLLKTSQQDSFIADDGVAKGIVFKRNSEWFFEYYKDEKLVSQKLNIKF
jgi:hypothetical protein